MNPFQQGLRAPLEQQVRIEDSHAAIVTPEKFEQAQKVIMLQHADHLQTVVSAVEEAGDVMHLSQNVVETFIDRIEVFDDERVKIHFTFEDVLADYAE